ncbi:hypothetical protein [Caballeronia sp. KNU42]
MTGLDDNAASISHPDDFLLSLHNGMIATKRSGHLSAGKTLS